MGGGVGDRRVADARLSVWEPQVGGGVGGVWVGVWVGSEKIQRMGVISKRSKNSQPHGLFRPPPNLQPKHSTASNLGRSLLSLNLSLACSSLPVVTLPRFMFQSAPATHPLPSLPHSRIMDVHTHPPFHMTRLFTSRHPLQLLLVCPLSQDLPMGSSRLQRICNVSHVSHVMTAHPPLLPCLLLPTSYCLQPPVCAAILQRAGPLS